MKVSSKTALGFIFITLLLDVIGFGIILPVLPKFIASISGAGLSQASWYSGWLMFAFSIMQFFFSPVLGSLSDRFGRRPVLLISLFGFGLNYLIIALAPNLMWLFVGRVLAGICGASTTTATAYIADVSTPEKRTQNFGLVGAAFGLGFIIGPVLGGVLGQFDIRLPFYVASILTFVNWIYGYLVLPESLSADNRRKFDIKRANPVGSLMQIRKYPVISGAVMALVLVYVGSFATQSTWTFFTMEVYHWDEAMIGYSMGGVGLLMALVQGLLVRYTTPRLGVVYSIYIGQILTAIGLFSVAFITSTPTLAIMIVIYCLGGISSPAAQAVISNAVPDNEQGELQGALTSLISLTSIVGPIIMTGLFSHFTARNAPVYFPGAPFIMGGILTVISIFFAHSTLQAIRTDEKSVSQ